MHVFVYILSQDILLNCLLFSYILKMNNEPNCIVINIIIDQCTNYIYFQTAQPVSSIISPLVVSLRSFVSLSTQVVCCDQGLPPTFKKAWRYGYRDTNGTQVFLNLPSPFPHLSPDSCLLHSVSNNRCQNVRTLPATVDSFIISTLLFQWLFSPYRTVT